MPRALLGFQNTIDGQQFNDLEALIKAGGSSGGVDGSVLLGLTLESTPK